MDLKVKWITTLGMAWPIPSELGNWLGARSLDNTGTPKALFIDICFFSICRLTKEHKTSQQLTGKTWKDEA